MEIFTIITVLIIFSAFFGYINVRFLDMPNSIGLMVITLVFTMIVLAVGYFDTTLLEKERAFIQQIDFKTVLLDIMLSFLLFAGAMHTNFQQLKLQRKPILAFATMGTLVSTFLTATFVFTILKIVQLDVDFIYCLLFGALISPTDPIAVLGIMKKVGAPKKLETNIIGESLFNDGVGVVIFVTIYEIAEAGLEHASVMAVFELFLLEVVGGLLLGVLLGGITYGLLKSIDDYDTEVVITIATVMGGTSIAHYLHLSAPLAMVAAGLVVGNDTIRQTSMSEITEQYVDKFWELIDILFNTILFVMIGMELLMLTFNGRYMLAGLLTIPLLLFARYLSLLLPVRIYARRLNFVENTTAIMTWGGLRGGISIALALSLTPLMERELFLVMTYVIVVFSIIVQGLTMGKVIKKLT
ncbi:MAG: sodium:proton antiporter [Desulfuromusa sp.]